MVLVGSFDRVAEVGSRRRVLGYASHPYLTRWELRPVIVRVRLVHHMVRYRLYSLAGPMPVCVGHCDTQVTVHVFADWRLAVRRDPTDGVPCGPVRGDLPQPGDIGNAATWIVQCSRKRGVHLRLH